MQLQAHFFFHLVFSARPSGTDPEFGMFADEYCGLTPAIETSSWTSQSGSAWLPFSLLLRGSGKCGYVFELETRQALEQSLFVRISEIAQKI